MTDTFRALCAELLDVIDSLPSETNYRNESRCVFPIDEDVVFRARAALAEPESIKDRIAKADAAIEASMERIRAIASSFPARAHLNQSVPKELTDGKLEELADDYMVMDGSNGTMHLAHLDFARAAIAADRAFCARLSIKPVPVSERSPKAKDCDAQGNCWLANDSLEPCWILDNPKKWTNWTHWVPHWAMPIATK